MIGSLIALDMVELPTIGPRKRIDAPGAGPTGRILPRFTNDHVIFAVAIEIVHNRNRGPEMEVVAIPIAFPQQRTARARERVHRSCPEAVRAVLEPCAHNEIRVAISVQVTRASNGIAECRFSRCAIYDQQRRRALPRAHADASGVWTRGSVIARLRQNDVGNAIAVHITRTCDTYPKPNARLRAIEHAGGRTLCKCPRALGGGKRQANQHRTSALPDGVYVKRNPGANAHASSSANPPRA